MGHKAILEGEDGVSSSCPQRQSKGEGVPKGKGRALGAEKSVNDVGQARVTYGHFIGPRK